MIESFIHSDYQIPEITRKLTLDLRGCVQNKSNGGIYVDFSRRELLYERINRKDARSELKMFAIGYPSPTDLLPNALIGLIGRASIHL